MSRTGRSASRVDPYGLAFGQAGPAEVLRRLDLLVNRRLDGVLQGDYRGLVPGHGTEPGETRRYQPGDDVRRIDWNVTARSLDAHVRETIADRELETWVLLDQSPSLDFGTALYLKRELALIALAGVGFLTARAGNRIGAVLAGGSDRPEVLPARRGRSHLLTMLHRAATTPTPAASASASAPGASVGRTELGAAIERLSALHRRRGLAVVISDFLAADDWSRPMTRLAARHETLAIEVIDPRELELPAVGVLTLVDPETGRRREVQTSSAKLRARYAEAATAQRATIASHLRASGADHLVLRTDRDWLKDLIRFIALRRERAAHISRSKP